nr:MAG TPA: Phosphodiester glycosidase [Caudoviricetes sp.]
MGARKESEIAVSIPLEDIDRIEIYNNKLIKSKKSYNRMMLSTIIAETGADYAINGTLYNMKNGKPVCPLRADGTSMYEGTYKYRGYVWDEPSNFHMDLVPNNGFMNYIACSEILRGGEVNKRPIYNVAQGGRRGRTAIGTKVINGKTRICLYASKDGTRAKKTPEQLASLLKSYGWRDAIMLDCGGSSQAYFDNEKRQVYSMRRVPHVILIYLKKGKK